MRQPPTELVVLVHQRPRGRDRLDNGLLAGDEVGRHGGNQTDPAAPEGTHGIENHVVRSLIGQRGDHVLDGVEVPAEQHHVGHVRPVPPVSVRAQGAHATLLQPVPQGA